MALGDSVLLNGVTKAETDSGFVYQFGLVIIQTFTTPNSYTLTWRGQTTSTLTQYQNIPDKLGATDIEGYVDKLAEQGKYQAGEKAALTEYSENFSAFEKRQLAYLTNIGEALNDIIFLLQKLNE